MKTDGTHSQIHLSMLQTGPRKAHSHMYLVLTSSTTSTLKSIDFRSVKSKRMKLNQLIKNFNMPKM